MSTTHERAAQLEEIADNLDLAEREGAARDEPEGARFVKMSSTLARAVADTLRRIARESRGDAADALRQVAAELRAEAQCDSIAGSATRTADAAWIEQRAEELER